VINFRFHIVSLIAVFLALGIGIIMGTAVIDRAVVDRLERQQSSLRKSVDDVRTTNRRLAQELSDEQDAANRLADEGSQRLLNGALTDTPVLLIGVRGAEADGLDDLVTLLGRANADYRGTLWLTKNFALEKENEVRDLAEALSETETSASALRTLAIGRIALALRSTTRGGSTDPNDKTIANLRQAGFIDYSPAPGGKADELPLLPSGTRLVAVSGAKAQVPDRQLMLPLVRALVAARADREPVGLLAVSGQPPADKKNDTFIGPIRQDSTLGGRLSTVDDIDDFSGRLATVLSLVDLGFGRVGDFGRGSGAQHLLPAPAS
jgi:hypothetical protein